MCANNETSNPAALIESVAKALRQEGVPSGGGWRFQFATACRNELDGNLYFAFPEHPDLDLIVRFDGNNVILEPGRGDPRDTVVGSVRAFLDFVENRRSAQVLFLDDDWGLHKGAGKGKGDLDDLRTYLLEFEKILVPQYVVTSRLRERVRESSMRIENGFQIQRLPDLTPHEFVNRFVRTGTPVVLEGATPVDWWSFARLMELFRGVYTHLSRYPNGSYSVDDCLEKIATGDPHAFKAALPLTRSIRSQYSIRDFFPAEGIFEKAQTLLIAPADHLMPDSYRATAWHRDWADNLLTQLVGEKRVRVASPLAETQFAPRTTPPCHYNVGVDFSEVDPKEMPAPDGVEVCYVSLTPGDMLFIPCGWFHTVENRTASCAINCWRVCPPEMLEL